MRELISALADGQLQGEAFARGVEAAAADPQAREAWHTYHLIGDVLRSGELAACSAARRLSWRGLSSACSQEPLQPAGGAMPRPSPERAAIVAAARPPTTPASAGSWWRAFASFAAVAAIGWTRGRAAVRSNQSRPSWPPRRGTVLAGSQRRP